ncbi:MAG: pseudouridine synthase, partial [Bosea sp. (in: a-proteobacteria)]
HEGRGREAITHINVLERYTGPENEPIASLIACQLETGRTHQIRVHLSHAGYPLLGDPLYGTGYMTKASKLAEKPRAALRMLGRQALHATMLGFAHPLTNETMIFERDPPEDFANLQEALANP